jgi:hypothetical protein
MFADAEELDTHLVGQHPLFDKVPDCLSVRQWAIFIVMGDIAECVEAEDEWERLSRASWLLCGL